MALLDAISYMTFTTLRSEARYDAIVVDAFWEA